MSKWAGVWLLAGALLLGACGSNPANTKTGNPAADELTRAQAQAMADNQESQAMPSSTQASFDFKGTVEEGPSKGTVLAGTLTLDLKSIGDGNSVFMGALKSADSKLNIPAKGVLTKKGNLYVFFDVDASEGQVIFGIGKKAEDGGFAGPFYGPTGGDKGSWTAKPLVSSPPPQPQTLNYDFSGTVDQGPAKGTKLTGGLSLELKKSSGGYSRFEGSLTLTDGTKISAKGAIIADKAVFVVFDLGKNSRIIGQGEIKSDGSIAGPFTLFAKGEGKGAEISSGSWTATPTGVTPNPQPSTQYDFKASVTDGPAKGATLEGVLTVGEKGSFEGVLKAGGTSTPVKASALAVSIVNGEIKVSLELMGGVKVEGMGKTNPDGSLSGTFAITIGSDKSSGTWTATPKK